MDHRGGGRLGQIQGRITDRGSLLVGPYIHPGGFQKALRRHGGRELRGRPGKTPRAVQAAFPVEPHRGREFHGGTRARQPGHPSRDPILGRAGPDQLGKIEGRGRAPRKTDKTRRDGY